MSSSKRPAILMGILLLLLLAYLVDTRFKSLLRQNYVPPAAQLAPLPGKTSVSNLKAHQDVMGSWMADFDYFYTGEPRYPVLYVELDPQATSANDKGKGSLEFPQRSTFVPHLQLGTHHVSLAIAYPGSERTTRLVAVTLKDQLHRTIVATQQIDQAIEWPTFATWAQLQQMSQNTPEQNLRRAVELIDSENETQLVEAKMILEKLISRNAQFDAAYVELARDTLKSNWGPEGLHQAEDLLSSALQIRPDSANAKILLGYIYAHENRFAKAQELFTDAAVSNPPNLWLWSNWGEMLALQRNYVQAIAKYREAIAHPVTHDTYDRARKFAYKRLLELLGQKKDLDGMEALYKQQVAEYGPGSCYSSDYARFLLQVRGDTQGAIDLARRALNQDCEDSPAREVLGLAEYVKWANATGPERAESLNQARIYLPAGPTPLYLLATSDRTSPAIKQLIAAGERIDQKDNRNQTALAYALQNGDLGAAKRLLTLHARPDAPVGYEDVPLALVPVMQGNIEAIRLMREFGVNYSKLRYRGATAIDFAKQSGNHALLDALGRNEATL